MNIFCSAIVEILYTPVNYIVEIIERNYIAPSKHENISWIR